LNLPEFASFSRISTALTSGVLVSGASILESVAARRLNRVHLMSLMPIAAVSINHLSEAKIPESLARSSDLWSRIAAEDKEFKFARVTYPGLLANHGIASQDETVKKVIASTREFRNSSAIRSKVTTGLRQSFENLIRMLTFQLPKLVPASTNSIRGAFPAQLIQSQSSSTDQLVQESNNLINAGGVIGGAATVVGAFAPTGSTAAAAAVAVAGAGGLLVLAGPVGLAVAWWLTH